MEHQRTTRLLHLLPTGKIYVEICPVLWYTDDILRCSFLRWWQSAGTAHEFMPSMRKRKLEQTVAWVIAGIPTAVTHAISNFTTGLLIIPLSDLLRKLDKQPGGLTI